MPDGDETPPHVHDILIEDVTGTDVYTDYFFRGLPEAPIAKVELRRVQFYNSGSTTACEEVEGSCKGSWPCPPCFQDLREDAGHSHFLFPWSKAVASDGLHVQDVSVVENYEDEA